LIKSTRIGSAGLGKRIHEITTPGRVVFEERLAETSSNEQTRSEFLSALYFCDQLGLDDITQLIDERLCEHRRERRRSLGLPMASMTEGQRFTIRYVLAMKTAAIEFLQGEGRAIETAIRRERYQ
jgi:hypothetical protein